MDAVLHLTSLSRHLGVAAAVTESAAALAGFKKPQARRLSRSLAKGLRELARRGAAEPLRILCAIQERSIDVEIRWRGVAKIGPAVPPGWSRVRGGAQSCIWRAKGT